MKTNFYFLSRCPINVNNDINSNNLMIDSISQVIMEQQTWEGLAILVCVEVLQGLVSRDGKGGLLGRGTE